MWAEVLKNATKKEETSVRTVDVLTRIHNGHLLNTSAKLPLKSTHSKKHESTSHQDFFLRSMSLIKLHTSCSTNSVTMPKHDV